MFDYPITMILFVSILFQAASALTALIMIRKSGFFSPWLLITVAISLMAVRRISTLDNLLEMSSIPARPLGPEIIALCISILMFSGLFLFQPVFQHFKDKQNSDGNKIRDMDMQVRESHHHVKNDLQLLQSLVNIQKCTTKNDEQREFLGKLELRIRTFSLLHENMYKCSDDHISFRSYLESLIKNIFSAYATDIDNLSIEKNIDELQVNRKELLYCGLVINESITNACKYAFPDCNNPKIMVTAKTGLSGQRSLTVSDNGQGLKQSDVLQQNPEHFGFTLLQCIDSTENWHIELQSGKSAGTTIQFTF